MPSLKKIVKFEITDETNKITVSSNKRLKTLKDVKPWGIGRKCTHLIYQQFSRVKREEIYQAKMRNLNSYILHVNTNDL